VISPQQALRDQQIVRQLHAAQSVGRQIVTQRRIQRLQNPARQPGLQRQKGSPQQPGLPNRPGQQQPPGLQRQPAAPGVLRPGLQNKPALRQRPAVLAPKRRPKDIR
jgi:hypothetical protein